MNTKSGSFAKPFLFNALFLIVLGLILGYPRESLGARLKDIASVKGVRENILIGYGIVVGLNGTGDGNGDLTGQSLSRLFTKLGLQVQGNFQSKNAAAVIVTSKLLPFARVGQKLDVTISSIGDASSLEGGILLVTPLRAGDQSVYAVAQGPVTLGGLANGGGEGFPTVGRVVSGATIEKDLDVNFSKKKNFRLSLHNPDFTTSARISALINQQLGGRFAMSRDSGTIDIVVPYNYEGSTVELLATLENLKVNIDTKAKVVLNERTGTVVMGGDVTISPVAIAHNELAIEVKQPQAGAAAGAAPPPGGGKKNVKRESLANIKAASVSDLVKALNALGIKPKDFTAIFQSLRRAGALQAELDIM